MKNEKSDLTRRTFLSKGVAIAATSSIIAIETFGNTKQNGQNSTGNVLTNDPVFTESSQTLINKKIPSRSNTLGTDYVNIKEFPITGNNITSALNSAITALSQEGSRGGQILIPHGIWYSDGGHDIKDSISIEGVGFNLNPGEYETGNNSHGTDIKLTCLSACLPDPRGDSPNVVARYVFRINAGDITAGRRNCSLKNLSIDMRNAGGPATGLIMTNASPGNPVGIIYFTGLENVGFFGGDYGIKVDSGAGSSLECILNRFERCSFIGCQTAFSCNTINSGFAFDTCYFSIAEGGTAFDCATIGNLSVEHCLFPGNSKSTPGVPATDGSTILKTLNAYNNISFFDCQDENVEFTYQNGSNPYDFVPLVFRNCLIQSKLTFNAHGSVVFDSCRIHVDVAEGQAGNGAVQDNPDGSSAARVYLRGLSNVYWTEYPNPPNPPEDHNDGKIGNFSNKYGLSRVIYDAKEVRSLDVRVSGSGLTVYDNVNSTRGILRIPATAAFIQVNSQLVARTDPFNSFVFAVLRDSAASGATIKSVEIFDGGFYIHLTAAPGGTNGVTVGFKVEGGINVFD